MATVGIDVGGTKLSSVLRDHGNVLFPLLRPAPIGSYDDLLLAIEDTVAGYRADHPIEAVGVCVAAWMSADRELVRRSANLGWDDKPLRTDLAHRLELPVTVANDADAAAWGGYLDIGRPTGNLVALTLGTDVGGAVIIDGRLITGTHGVAGELGHLVIDPAGPRCVCGTHGCLATYASGTAMLRRARALASESPGQFPMLLSGTSSHDITGLDIARAATDGIEGPLLLAEAATAIARASALISRVIDHSTLLLAGGASSIGAPLVHAVKSALTDTELIGPVHPMPNILLVSDPDFAGARGAADFAARLLV
ncbi:MAG: ROK family protein [Actinomycetota bacterium]|nr:ROK family protein [Actinomycetota bacterium]